jgi:hypothetical protein
MSSSRTTPTSLVDSSRVAIGDQLRQSRTCTYAEMDQAEAIVLIFRYIQHTLSSHPPTTRNIPLGCQATLRMPKPGSVSGEKVAKMVPDSDNT